LFTTFGNLPARPPITVIAARPHGHVLLKNLFFSDLAKR